MANRRETRLKRWQTWWMKRWQTGKVKTLANLVDETLANLKGLPKVNQRERDYFLLATFQVLLTSMSAKNPKVFFITPPFTQLNTPYPATAYLKGFLNTKNLLTIFEKNTLIT